jgi:hypothetical protein
MPPALPLAATSNLSRQRRHHSLLAASAKIRGWILARNIAGLKRTGGTLLDSFGPRPAT